MLLGVSVRVVSCLVLDEMRLVLLERRGTTGKAETTRLAGGARQTCKAVVTGETDKAPANSRTREALCPSHMLRGEAGEALAL